jgi:hypothetical protein
MATRIERNSAVPATTTADPRHADRMVARVSLSLKYGWSSGSPSCWQLPNSKAPKHELRERVYVTKRGRPGHPMTKVPASICGNGQLQAKMSAAEPHQLMPAR